MTNLFSFAGSIKEVRMADGVDNNTHAASPLLSLPNETLLNIAYFLRTRDVEAWAQTFNTRLTPLCLRLLANWLFTVRNERRMVALFGRPDYGHIERQTFEEIFEYCGTELGEFSEPTETPVKRWEVWDYLRLKGDYQWLIDISGRPSDRSYEDKSVASAADMIIFEQTCRSLGLSLPKSFVRFMTDGALQHHLCWNDVYHLDFDPSTCTLHKIISSRKAPTSRGTHYKIDGYACRIFNGSRAGYVAPA
jgi:hypothetical protein